MRSLLFHPSVVVGVVVIALLTVAARAFAQAVIPGPWEGPYPPNTTVVAIAMTNDLPVADDVVIVRRTNQKPQDVILVRPSALTGDILARAMQRLHTTRRTFGRLPTQDMTVKVESSGANKPPRASEAAGWAASLRSAKPLNLQGVGPVPLILVHPFDSEITKSTAP
jgi:hypothetical protein